ncbi:hypothetical protein FSP39_021996 [Pinctada imbricata]|uniref:Cadherin domain-containing protein n=1 Tax=Pinctada imbricata TaxID=66713 RepID=A0AA88YVY5_PINIB|nr:hypothetical protein FSP39_021996 [Pinctada imbricata]
MCHNAFIIFQRHIVVYGADPVFTTPSGGTATTSVDEDVATGTSVFSVTATDADVGDVLTYSVTGSAVSHFTIDGQIIKTSNTFDYESTTSYDVLVTCSDGVNTVTATVTVNINDVNEFTPVFNPSVIAATLAENTGSDSDGSTSSCSLSIQSGDTSSNFQISGGGSDVVTSSTAIDYESLSSQNYIIALVIIGTDGASSEKTGTATVYVTVTNQNEGTPSITGTTPDPVSVSEDASVGTSVCTVGATDTDDGVYGTITFAIDSEYKQVNLNKISQVSEDASVGRYYVCIDGTITGDGGNTGTAFSIDASSGVIYTAASLDRETLSSYNLVVSASDGASPALSATSTVAISINDVNDNAPSCSPDVTAVDVSETTSSGSMVHTFACTDADGDSLSYSIASGNSGGEFSMTAAGVLSLSSALDYDGGTTSYQLLIDVDDSSTTSTTTININVVAENEDTPAFASNPTVSINENEAVGTSVTTYTAADTDASPHDVTQYAITSVTNTGSSKFSIDQSSGLISLAQTLDYETTTSYEITVQATDGGGSTEHAVIASFGCTDADASASLTYTLSLTPSDGAFSASSSLSVASSLNYETTTSYTGTVTVSDGTNSVTISLSITITNVNEHTPSISGTNPSPISIAEDTAVSTSVCTVLASDSDSGTDGDLTYSITSGNSGSEFTIDSASGIIYTAKTLDYESTTSYTLTVQATDGGTTPLSATADITVTVTDVNDNAPTCTPYVYNANVPENSATGTTVATMTCSDGDSNTLTYGITSGNSDGKFALGSTAATANEVTLNAAVDYDSGTTSYTLVVNVDDGTYTATTTVNINVDNVNEATPSFASNPTVSLAENTAVGSTVTTYTATDSDASPDDIVSYSINSVTNSGISLFSIDASTAVIQLANSLDYETTTVYEITVFATDGGSLQGSGTVTVSVTDINDNTPTCTTYAWTLDVNENTAASTSVISDFGCSDSDAGTSLTYTLSMTPSGAFSVSGTSLIVSGTLDYETTSSYSGTVTVSDGTMSTTICVTVSIGNLNDNTPSITGTTPSTISLAEDTAVATSVCTMVATDADSGTFGELTYSIISGNSGSEFLIDSRSGQISTTASLDYETTTSYSLTVQADDGGSPARSDTYVVSISVTDVNDNQPTCSPVVYNVDVSETTATGTTITTMTCTDGDSNTLSYAINSGNSAGKFALGSTVATANEITLNAAVDYESGTLSYSLLINVDDSTYTATVTVNMNIVAVNEDTPAFSTNPTVTIAEDSSVGTVLTTYAATDTDSSPHDITSYNIQSATNSGASFFSIDSTTGAISLSQPLDYETTTSYELTIVATDGGSLEGTGTVTVSVTDVNDNTPQCSPSAYALTVAEDAATSYVIATLTCTDGDGNSMAYTMSQNPGSKFDVSSSGDVSVNGSTCFFSNR